MYRYDRPRERLLHLLDLMETANRHLQRAEELKRQAVDSLKEAEASHRRVASSSRPLADSAGLASYDS
jgi:hypothetical protein